MAFRSTTWALLLVLLSSCLLALVAAQSEAEVSPAPAESPAPEPSSEPTPGDGGGGGDPDTGLSAALDLQNGFKLTKDGTGFIATHGASTFTIRLTCVREISKGGGAVQEAKLATGTTQAIKPVELWDPDLESVYSVR
jgi:hypothetical protein